MYCSNCGRELIDGSRFCSWCGTDQAGPPAVPESAPPAAPRVKPVTHPWMRYFARSVDVSLLFAVFLWVRFSVGVRLDSGAGFALGFVVYLVLVGIETALLTRFGTTVGKWLFQIRVASKAGGLPTLRQALQRTFLVFVRGLGLGLPLITVIAQIIGYVQLTREGETTWDRDSFCEVRHAEIGMGRAVLIAVTFFALAVSIMVLMMASSTVPGDIDV